MEYLWPESDLKEIVLNHYLHYEPFTVPVEENVTAVNLPDQDKNKLGTTISLYYLDERINLRSKGEFTIVRWDLEKPFRVIVVNDHLHMILVSNSIEIKDKYYVHSFPIQNNAFLGVDTIDNYHKSSIKNIGKVLRCDVGGDIMHTVLYERLNLESGRLVTLEETKAICQRTDIAEKFIPLHSEQPWWPKNWRIL